MLHCCSQGFYAIKILLQRYQQYTNQNVRQSFSEYSLFKYVIILPATAATEEVVADGEGPTTVFPIDEEDVDGALLSEDEISAEEASIWTKSCDVDVDVDPDDDEDPPSIIFSFIYQMTPNLGNLLSITKLSPIK